MLNLVVSPSAAAQPPASSAPEEPVVSRYEVVAGPGARELRIEAAFAAGTDALMLPEACQPFVRDLEIEDSGRWRPISLDALARLPTRPRQGYRLRYRFLLGEAAADSRSIRRVLGVEGALLATPSWWLLRPVNAAPGRRYRLHVATPPGGVTFVTGLFAAPDGAAGTYEADVASLEDAPYSGFGSFEVVRIEVGSASVDLAVPPGERALSRDALARWAERSAGAVAAYFGRFPVPRVLVIVLAGGRRSVGFGTTRGGGGASIVVWVGRGATEDDLARDWVLTHEMVHLGMPDITDGPTWFDEGLATYVEPVARARLGILTEADVWREMVEGLPRGLARGLAHSEGRSESRDDRWGPVYWGGALYWLEADIEIRRRTGGRRCLADALRGILAAGGNLSVRWNLDRVLDTAGRATGVPVLRELYARWPPSSSAVDLEALFQRLGVVKREGGIAFDDKAPLAALRRSITTTTGADGPPASAGPLAPAGRPTPRP